MIALESYYYASKAYTGSQLNSHPA